MFNYAVGAVNAANDEFQDFPRPVVGIGLQYGVNPAACHMALGKSLEQVVEDTRSLTVDNENVLVVGIGNRIRLVHQGEKLVNGIMGASYKTTVTVPPEAVPVVMAVPSLFLSLHV